MPAFVISVPRRICLIAHCKLIMFPPQLRIERMLEFKFLSFLSFLVVTSLFREGKGSRSLKPLLQLAFPQGQAS